jgi:hypothetical protein
MAAVPYPNQETMKPSLVSAFIFVLLANLGFAQQEKEQVTLQFVTFPKWTTREPIQMVIGEGETLEFTAPSNSFSKEYQVPKMDNWVFGKMKADEKGKQVFETFGQGKSLDSKKQLILLIRVGKEAKDGLKVVALDAQLNQFGGGEFFYYNASTFDIAGAMGKSKFLLKPGEYKIIKPKSEDIDVKEGYSFVQTVHLYRKEDQSDPFFNSTWHVNPKARSMVFFYQDNVAKRLKMHTLQDFLP